MLDTTGIVFRELDGNSDVPRVLEHAVKAWRAFCTLPADIKAKFSMPQFETDYADPGYFKKDKNAGYDEKQYFHVFSCTRVFLHMTGYPESRWPREAREFLTSAEHLLSHMTDLLTETNRGFFEEDKLACRLKEELVDSRSIITLRFLKYDTATFGEQIAIPHPDKCGLTAHLYSSHPGLQYLKNDHDYTTNRLPLWYDLEVPSGNVAFFNGSQMLQFSDKRVKPLIHRVIQVGSERESRESVVLFAPFIHMPRSPKDKRISASMKGLSFSGTS